MVPTKPNAAAAIVARTINFAGLTAFKHIEFIFLVFFCLPVALFNFSVGGGYFNGSIKSVIAF